MSIIILIRHGQSVINVNRILSHDINGNPLTDEGIKQAKKAAQELKKLPKISVIFTSPVCRALQTAKLIAEELNMGEPIIDDRLRERFMGELNNKKIDLSDHWKVKLERNEIKYEGIESWLSLEHRMVDFTSEIVSKYPNEVVIAVSHYDPIRALLGYILDLDDISAWGISIPNASLTTLNCKSTRVEECKILSVGAPIFSKELLYRLNSYIKVPNSA
ncbi:MAG: 2,3-diphosphoglycerate-dependent phosphoglycerate mutase [Sulfolobaceae archaeon]|nr:2,3-diphosphoglycerate-dependent phosphoglycerate mutase [Sulfolobaceae archaeon]